MVQDVASIHRKMTLVLLGLFFFSQETCWDPQEKDYEEMVNSLLAENKQLEVGFQRSPACVVADIKRSSCLGIGNWTCQLGYLMGLHSDT